MKEFLETWGNLIIGALIGITIIGLAIAFYFGPLSKFIISFLDKAV